MNRFEYATLTFLPNEVHLRTDRRVSLYDGETKTHFVTSDLVLTNYRIFWGQPNEVDNQGSRLALSLKYVIFLEEENPGAFSFSRSKKVVLHLTEPGPEKTKGPLDDSTKNYIKLSFKEGLDPNFIVQLSDALTRRAWEFMPPITESQQSGSSSMKRLPEIKTRTGIIGIERNLQERQKATDQSITMAFQDLRKLMEMAKDMVSISKTISTKIRERQGDITEDETVRFKSYLMSLGIDDPVTRDAYRSSNEYFRQLARQLADILEEPIKEVGGMMTLTDVYCRVNRARGLELLSPEDLLNASRQLGPLDLPLVLRVFDSGVMVLQIRSLDDEAVVESIAELLKDRGSISAEELAQSEGISVTLARERLLVTEKNGRACRDDSIEALRFYPNLFLEQDV
ncbi:vacuolar protein-sorting-associated protein 36 [Leptopilina heterotoma]|uniref:vacuolar protein-sorting-associated protein 36 n=1 Tax=Leptopilina heterotoma TaxID=63436 RepID=UPI001CA9F592|nr:vacuolar protein-sorting-associated protein 36 [Leptopilina heterotoma]